MTPRIPLRSALAVLALAALVALPAPPSAALPQDAPSLQDAAAAGAVAQGGAAAALGEETLDADTLAALRLPEPDLSAMRPAAQARVRSLEDGVRSLLAGEAPRRLETAQGFGFLGQVYQALDLPGAAAEAYETARRLFPPDARWTYYLGLVHQAQGDLEGAVKEYARYADAAPDDPAVRLRLGDALLQLGDAENAEMAYRQALELARAAEAEDGAGEATRGGDAAAGSAPKEGAASNPGPPPTGGVAAAALAGLGRAALARGDAADAAELLERALELQPQADALHYSLSQAYRALDQERLARYHLALRGEREPAFSDEHAAVLGGIAKSVAVEVVRDLAAADDFSETDFLGFVLSQLGAAPGPAAQALGAVMRQEASAPPSVRGHLAAARGVLLGRAGDDAAAAELLATAVSLDPSLVETRLHLGNARARSGDFSGALESYDQVLAARPDDAEALVQRGSVRANLGQLGEARSDLEAAVKAAPDDAEAYLRLGEVQARAGEPDAALTSLDRAAELAPGGTFAAEARTRMAEIERRRGDATAAAEQYARALDADPRHEPALSGLASLLGATKHYREAATLYRRLVEEDPDDRVARMGEVTALVLAGADAAAKERMEAALARHPDDVAFQDVLARHLAAASDPSVRDGARAVELANQVYEKASTPESMETLAMAYAQAGNFEEAVRWQQRLLDTLAGGDVEAEPGVEARLRANLERYRRGQACCADVPSLTGAAAQ